MRGVKINFIIFYYPPRSLLLFFPLILSTLPLLLSLVFVLFVVYRRCLCLRRLRHLRRLRRLRLRLRRLRPSHHILIVE